MAARLRKNDQVEVISGSDRGKRGKILQMLPRENRAIVEGVKLAKHHERPKSYQQPGGIVVREASIHLSNLALVDPASGKATKVGFRIGADGKKLRVAKASGQVIEG